MAQNELLIPGHSAPIRTYEAPAGLEVEVLHEATFAGARRGAADEHRFEGAEDDDLIEIEYEDGSFRWLRVDEYRDERAAEGDRDAAKGRIRLVPERSRATRDSFDWMWKGLKILRISPTEAAARGAAKLAKLHFEDKLDPGPGLYRIESPKRPGSQITSADQLQGDEKYLLLLHGTFSSTAASFGALDPAPSGGVWDRLQASYKERILALEHRTLSESPITNALDLVRLLPEGALLHMISHSRGGLVGELLAAADIPKAWIDTYERKDKKYRKYDEPDRAQLRQLIELLNEKSIRVERFVRVACPSRGTPLGKRLSLWLSVSMNLLGRIPALGANPIYSFAKATVLELIRLRKDPRELPGIEAQMPESPLVRLLELAPAVDSDLAVVAGDLDGEGLGSCIFEWATNAFYWSTRHDLVVPTSDMDGGMPRTGGFQVAVDEGPRVNHFNYFENPKSAGWVLEGLGPREERSEEFDHVARGVPAERRSVRGTRGASRGEDRPVVFVLPGIMGSRLACNGEEIWVDMFELAFGGLHKLAAGRSGIAAEGLIGSVYGDLIDFLADTHEVRPFPYDWRNSLEDSAAQLATAIQDVLQETQQPVRLIAHSMGGLVVRTLIASHGSTWDALRERDGGRVVMLGTPNDGSFAIPRALLGRDRLVRMLALLDVRTPAHEILDVLARFPGVLDLLPSASGADGRVDLFKPDAWERMRKVEGGRWTGPQGAELKRARKRRQALQEALPGADRLLYVAGHAESTPSGVRIEDDRVVFFGTPKGDGRVTWESGRLDGIRTWYMEANHGALPRHEPAFPALLQLLESGDTRLLSEKEPARRGVPDSFDLPASDPTAFPGERALEDAAVGGPATHRRLDRQRLHVSAIHGDLLHRDGRVVLVGHHRGDTIVSAEAILDGKKALDGLLTERYDLGLYPGAIGTAEIVLRRQGEDPTGPRGALVVGLGPVGQLTWNQLVGTVMQGVLRYALEDEEDAEEGNGARRLSAVLVGAGEGSRLSIAESVGAVTRGVLDANRTLRENQKADRVITELEFVELFEEVATEAAHAIRKLNESQAREDEVIEAEPFLVTGKEGLRRITATQGGEQWWRRISVRTDETRQNLFYHVLTDRAGTEIRAHAVQRELIDELSVDVRKSRQQGAASTTLFQLLVPPELRQAFRENRKTILEVESDTANIPWELLAERSLDSDGRRREAEPLAVGAGLMRQFLSDEEPARRSLAVGNDVLVIGDPLTGSDGFPQLEGARDEAKAVSDLFEAHGFFAPPLLQEDWRPILEALFSRPWRILHIAAHGHLASDPLDSGVVLADGRRLTAREMGSLDPVPEFVFLNCCHLAKVDSGEEQRVDFPRLAGGISEALIHHGVRAVVAAGWAVGDAAALTFARALYRHLLDGESLGIAIRIARKEAATHRSVNTWGAYQCYGDPDFRLSKPPEARREPRLPISQRELLDELGNLQQQADPKRLEKEVDQLLSRTPPDWQNGEALTVLGEAYRRANMFERAIDAYERALQREKGDAALRAVEQLANLRVRLAESLHGTDPERAQEIVKHGIETIKHLLAVGETAERRSLLGSAKKRQALVTKGATSLEAIAESAEAYRAAYDLARSRPGTEVAYSALNWLTMEYLRRAISKEEIELDEEGRKVLQVARDSGRERAARPNATIWDFAADADAKLVESLWDDTLEARFDAMVRSYETARRKGSPGEYASVTGQIGFMIQVLADGEGSKDVQLLERLRGEVSST